MYSDNPPLPQVENRFPPGLVGDVAQLIYDAAPRPNHDVALAGALALIAGICGRSYLTPTGDGVNLYIILLAASGMGKDAVASAIGKLFAKVKVFCPSISDFKGPGELASAPALIKWLADNPCVLCILGEIGKLIQMMAAPSANAHLKGIHRVLLQMYSKSGRNEVFDPMAYSDKEKNVRAISSPSLTIFGETVPDSFHLDESLIEDGLLPRFLVWNVDGERV